MSERSEEEKFEKNKRKIKKLKKEGGKIKIRFLGFVNWGKGGRDEKKHTVAHAQKQDLKCLNKEKGGSV